jgi:hypothetical protein
MRLREWDRSIVARRADACLSAEEEVCCNGALPPIPRNLPLCCQNGGLGIGYRATLETLERRIGLRQECDPSADSSAGMARAASGRPGSHPSPRVSGAARTATPRGSSNHHGSDKTQFGNLDLIPEMG